MALENVLISNEEMVEAAVRVIEEHDPMIDVLNPAERPQAIARVAVGEYIIVSSEPIKRINSLH